MNKIIIAAAGSGKTTHIVNEAISNSNSRILITTFTDANTSEIKGRFYSKLGYIPKNIEILPWFTFLLSHCVRPYQGKLYSKRIDNLNLYNGTSAKFISEHDILNHYFDSQGKIYSDKISKFAYKCNELTGGMVIYRLSLIFDKIYIDETQDLSGWDLEILELLFKSDIGILCVGDPRQSTLKTNNSPKNKKKSQENLLSYFKSIEKNYHLDIDTTTLNINHRSVKPICDFSNSLYESANWPKTQSDFNPEYISHLGIFIIDTNDVKNYLSLYDPIQLRDSVTTEVYGSQPVLNFGKSKGLTLDRVLIYPTDTMLDWLYKKKELKPGTKCKLYVAITRARYSVGIVVSPKYKKLHCSLPLWNPLDVRNNPIF